MDYLTYGLLFLAGGLTSYVFFNRGPGPFERTIWYGLHQGKRVVVCIADEAYIFEMINNRLRITKGTSEFTEGDDYGMVPNDLDNVSSSESTDSTPSSLSDG